MLEEHSLRGLENELEVKECCKREEKRGNEKGKGTFSSSSTM